MPTDIETAFSLMVAAGNARVAISSPNDFASDVGDGSPRFPAATRALCVSTHGGEPFSFVMFFLPDGSICGASVFVDTSDPLASLLP